MFLNYLLWCPEWITFLINSHSQIHADSHHRLNREELVLFLFSSVPGVYFTCCLLADSSPAWPISICFDKNQSSKNNIPARLEGGGKRGGAEPVWAPVVRSVYGPVTSLAVQDLKAA